MAAGAYSKYRMNQKVFSQGTPADAVFYIEKGKVKVTVVSEQGKEAVVAVLGPDEFCGEGCLNGQPVRLATATAMTECEIMRLEKAAMIRVLHEEPAFSEMFVSHLLARTLRSSKRTWSTNCLIQARSAWHGPSCFSLELNNWWTKSASTRRSAHSRVRRAKAAPKKPAPHGGRGVIAAFLQPHDLAFRHCRCGSAKPTGLSVRASFSADWSGAPVPRPPVPCPSSETTVTLTLFLNIEHRIRRSTLQRLFGSFDIWRCTSRHLRWRRNTFRSNRSCFRPFLAP